ncbi:hypothetical protein PILCRDRAFT_369141 [Piloderma croceum F 1598]|uniref:Hydrophobin n=1 Tax=Piloderma croceum (strain F 1598) TaxID=765440 RepID=A0A0C3BEP6_PILCF|nr:hypothetical protein PILCRDRAFT_369141 [Piloderma croceum F 1598]
MLAKTVIAVSFAALAVAVPTGSTGQCSTAKQNCCKQVQEASDPDTNSLLGLLGIVADVQGLVGLSCSPLSVVGISSGCAETQTPVCCNNNEFNGLINIGCTPINLGL